MALGYLIESNESLNQVTPINLLPVALAKLQGFIESIAILPSSSLDFSCGWTRVAHTLRFTPLVVFYSKDDISELLKNPAFLTHNKFFVAWSDFSIELIERMSTPEGRSILLTGNQTLAEYFKQNKNVSVIIYNENESIEQINHSCYNKIIETIEGQGNRTFDEKTFSTVFSQDVSPIKAFLPPTELTDDLLCKANEIILTHTRGRVPKISHSHPDSTQESIRRNVDMMKEILSERFVDMALGNIAGEKTNVLPNIPASFRTRVQEFLTNLDSKTEQVKKESYLSLRQSAYELMKKILNFSEITLLIPTVNPACREYVLRSTLKEFPNIDETELNRFIDEILGGGRRVPIAMNGFSNDIIQITRDLAGVRLLENRFITYFTGLLASRRLSPVLKNVMAPAYLFNELYHLQTHIGSGYLSRDRGFQQLYTTAKKFKGVQQKLTSCIPAEYLEAITEVNPSFITFVSDLPFELASFQNDMAICQMFPTARIPITPMYSFLRYYNHVSRTHHVSVEAPNSTNTLVINSIPVEEKLYSEFDLFTTVCKDSGLNFKSKTVNSSSEFIEALSSEKPQILVYYGHASYNPVDDQGELFFKEDRLSYKTLQNIEAMPQMLFLIGCETASCSAFIGGLPSHLLSGGAHAVLATLFPIPADHAATFVGRFLSISTDSANRNQSINLSTVVLLARKQGWLYDNLDALIMHGDISLLEAADIMEEVVEKLDAESLARGKSMSIAEATPILERILGNHHLLETWKEIRADIVPYSLFFTLLGDAHNIYIS